MKTYIRFTLAILLMLIVGFFVTNFFVSKKVKTLLTEEKSLSFSGFDVNAFTGNLSLKDVKFDDVSNTIKIKEIDINVDILHYFLNEEIIIESIDAEELDLKLISSSDSKTKEGRKLKIVRIEKIKLKDANLIYDNKNKTVFELFKLNLKAENVTWPLDKNYKWLENETIAIDAKKLRYTMDTLHDLTSEAFQFSKHLLTFTDFSIKPKFTKSDYVNHIKKEKDLLNMKSKILKITGIGLQKKDSLLHVTSNKIQIDSTDFNIYRDKTIADDTSYKALYSKSLRELDFQLSIDSLMISKLDLTYQELLNNDRKASEIKFNAIEARVLNIHNSLNAKRPDIKVEAKAKFSEGSEIIFNYNFVPDHEQFYVSTDLKQIEDKSINGFFAPAMRMEMDGTINEIRTSIAGSNTEMNGDFTIAYEKLKLNILKKDGSKNNFASLISNAILRNKDVYNQYKLEKVKRDRTKSFWNYVWTFHLQGLKKSLL
ncbi:MAG: hypothetical protein R6V36_03635 [Psychroflexus sp.]